MADTISQDEINSILWRACDSFRGTVDATEYKDYILTMLFVKFVSDVWKDHYEQYRKQFGNDDERIRRKLERERFVLPDISTFDYIYGTREAPNLGEVINEALEHLELANKAKLAHVFRNIDFNSDSRLGNTNKRNHILKNLLEDFANPKLDLRPSRIKNLDVIGNAYEYLIGRFAGDAGKKAGEFYTPPEVSVLIAKLVAPQPGERVYDPACGSGSLLIKCAAEAGSHNIAIYGQEAISSTWALCMMNMFLHDMTIAHIEWGDTLLEPKHIAADKLMTFEVVVANPPFSLDKWGAERAGEEARHYNRWHRGVPPKSKGDYAFISHMIESTTPGTGRVAVVVPHGVLFRGGSEGEIRRKLIEENLLDAVIGLPSNLFFGTGIPAAILVLRRDRSKRTDVLFIDASREFEDSKNQKKLRVDVEVAKVVATYAKRKNVDKYAYVALRKEIEVNDFNLNIPRYVDTFEAEDAVDLAAVQTEIDGIEIELARVRKEMAKALKELGL
ncbi:type I restriction-modification system subunit M [Pyxidicoccus sp. MSG2]|uniref:type I restriction-modification system subunit M n=1 Tax=Pyxidicoccus sp. MSG2 TaxID=2996790 RepID=UPI0022717377|nr:type I restriction-modification system subunit M [Pyxidicoccus sp. MSG2]MCY1019689.1 type I restriction-modification system subunit M [Pyxidicoccus sp. MSG2]